MPFPFIDVCNLLESSYKQALLKKDHTSVVTRWFTRHRVRIDAHDTSLSALLSTLLPERRTDRVFCIKEPSLEKIIARALGLGQSRIHELASYKRPGSGLDLADSVERILTATPSPSSTHLRKVTVEDIDDLLHALAANVKWSSPSIRASQTLPVGDGRRHLEIMFQRASPQEAKWLTRLVLKTYQPLIFDVQFLCGLCHPLLPLVLRVREDFTSAVTLLQQERAVLLPTSLGNPLARETLLDKVKPKLGIKVGRQNWFKARSIKHCIDMAGQGRMSVEKKVDGEYCQVHVNATKGRFGIQIFSKSGKDSTEDRTGLINVILEALRIGRVGCSVNSQCILEGELLVYNDFHQKIQPFHQIRKHVSRRGRFLNTEQDSPPNPHNHLMIIFYDILLLDDQSLLGKRLGERWSHLRRIITCQKGRAELIDREWVDFGSRTGASQLRHVFAKAIMAKEEGLVVKPDAPYFNFQDAERRDGGLCIKMKKEYIGSFGEVGDFAVVGAGYSPTKAKAYAIPGVRWTHFFIGCLENREEVRQFKAVPRFKVVNHVELNQTLLQTLASQADPQPVPAADCLSAVLDISAGVLAQAGAEMSTAFRNPLIFDIRCFSFDRFGSTGYWSMRFPTVTRIHLDRDFTDAISFDDLQRMAIEAKRQGSPPDSQENLDWIARLEGADPRGRPVDAVSQLTVTSASTPSPCKSTQATRRSPISPAQVRRLSVVAEADGDPKQLITPPTSSDLEPQKLQATSQGSSSKRKTGASPKRTPSKRRRSRNDVGQSPSLSTPKRHRAPLQETTANASQESPLEKHKDRAVLTAAPSSPSDTPCDGERHAVPQKQMSRTSMTHGSVSIGGGVNSTSSTDAHESHAPSCPSAAVKCRFHRCEVILAPELVPASTELKQLLRDHGITPRLDCLEWTRTSVQQYKGQRKTVQLKSLLLVDTQLHEAATAVLLNRIEGLRGSIPSDHRRWVPVFDWRVLKAVSVLEQLGTEKTNQAVFDADKRWYCGLV